MNKPELPPRILAVLERCAVILIAATIGVLFFATLKSQVARAAEFPAQIGAGTLLAENGSGFDAAA